MTGSSGKDNDPRGGKVENKSQTSALGNSWPDECIGVRLQAKRSRRQNNLESSPLKWLLVPLFFF